MQVPNNFEGVELRCKVDRAFGISRSAGLAWMEAARHGDVAMLRTLLAEVKRNEPETKPEGANGASAVWRLMHYNGQGTTYGFIGSIALHWACAIGDDDMVELLLSNGSSVNCQNNGGSTPLHSAVGNCQLNAVKALVARGANISITDCCGETPLDVCHNFMSDPKWSDAELRAFQQIAEVLGGFELAGSMSRVPPTQWAFGDVRKMVILMVRARVPGLPSDERDLAAVKEKSEWMELCARGLDVVRDISASTAAADDAATVFLKGVWERHRKQLGQEVGDEDGERSQEAAHAARAREKGNRHFQAKEFKKAIQMYTLAISIEPMNGTHYSNRAAAYLAANQVTAAFKDGKLAVQRRPDWPKAYHRLGSAALRLGRLKLAQKTFIEGLRVAKPEERAPLEEGLAQVEASIAKNAHHEDPVTSEDEEDRIPHLPPPGAHRGRVEVAESSDEDEEEGVGEGLDYASVDEKQEFEKFASQFGNDPGKMMAELQRRAFGAPAPARPPVAQRVEAARARSLPTEEDRTPAPPAVPIGQRKPWFDCSLCDNRTRDRFDAPCCGGSMCGTCWRRRKGGKCPLCGAYVPS